MSKFPRLSQSCPFGDVLARLEPDSTVACPQVQEAKILLADQRLNGSDDFGKDPPLFLVSSALTPLNAFGGVLSGFLTPEFARAKLGSRGVVILPAF